jgi:hypothetical protein
LTDAAKAGRAAAEAAISFLDGAPPTLVLVYSSVAYDLRELLAAVHEVTDGAPLAGATASGLLADGRLVRPGSGVIVLALAGDRYRFGVSSVVGLEDAATAGRTLARAAREAARAGDATYSAVVLLSAASSLMSQAVQGSDNQSLLNGVHRVTGASVPVVGGAAGDDHQFGPTYVFHNSSVLTDAAVAVWVASQEPLTVVHEHGWTPISLPMLITNVDGPRLHEIEGRPAIEVYAEHVERGEGPTTDRRRRWREEITAHGLGIIEPDGSVAVRAVFESGEPPVLTTFSPTPPYAAVQVMGCEPDDLLNVLPSIAKRALDGRQSSVLLAFSCLGRLDILGEDAEAEAARLQHAAGDVATFGFYTHGEFARTDSVAGYHNATVAALAL